MTKLVKIVDNKYVQIEEHLSPNICFNTNEYDDFEDYCTLRETFDPFEMFYENQKYKEVIDKAIAYLEKSKLNQLDTYCKYLYIDFDTGKIENIDELLQILKGEK